MQRINIVGTSGSGKSTFAEKLAQKLGYPLIEIDRLHWGPKWTAVSAETLRERLHEALLGDHWILDGNYGEYTSLKWEKVTHVIWLDYSYKHVIRQIIQRSIVRILKKSDLWGTGNRETVRNSFFSRKSVILWAIQTHHENRQKYLARMQAIENSHICFIRLQSRKEADTFLRTIH